MSHHFRSLLLIALIVALPLPVGVQAAQSSRVANQPAPTGPTAPDAATWYNGLIDYSTIINCASIIQGFPYQEYGAGTYVGFLADLNAGQPALNTIYYVHVVISGLGNSCSGMRAYPDLALPASTSLAIGPGNPVYCFYDGVQFASGCPQSLPSSTYHTGAYAIPFTLDGESAFMNQPNSPSRTRRVAIHAQSWAWAMICARDGATGVPSDRYCEGNSVSHFSATVSADHPCGAKGSTRSTTCRWFDITA